MELLTEQHGDLLTARVGGQFSLQGAKEALVKLFDAIAQYGANRVLVDCRALQGFITTVEDYEHAVFAAQLLRKYSNRGVSLGTRFAYVTTGSFRDPERFGETVAVNRGINVATFFDVDQALEWLGEGPTTTTGTGDE